MNSKRYTQVTVRTVGGTSLRPQPITGPFVPCLKAGMWRRTAGGMGAVTRIYGALCGSPCDVTLRLKSLAAGRVVIGVGSQLSGAFRTPAPFPGRYVSRVEAPRWTAAASRLWSAISAAVMPESHRGQALPPPPSAPVVESVRSASPSSSMQLLVVLAALMGVLFSVRAAVLLPADDRSNNFHSSRELSKERKELILKLVSGLLEGAPDSNMLPGEPSDSLLELEEPLESRLEERAVYNRLSLPQRDRKAPCKNFFWKTFTSC
ncbi:unnamed protein product [Boreogadus saida]